jgi:hypothetical protein
MTVTGHYRKKKEVNLYVALLRCEVCKSGTTAEFLDQHFDYWVQGAIDRTPTLVASWPTPSRPDAPQYLPDNIRLFYVQGVEALQRRSYDAAGPMFRRCLDVSLKIIHSEANPRESIFKRIEGLPLELGVTPAMKSWAHQIRELGNDAAHEDEPVQEADAKALKSFTEMFLTYLFTLPTMLELRKTEASKAAALGS